MCAEINKRDTRLCLPYSQISPDSATLLAEQCESGTVLNERGGSMNDPVDTETSSVRTLYYVSYLILVNVHLS